MSRPQIGIDRLPARRMSNEPRESMNCKSCRKRKIKCNRLRPTCEACQIFACPCIYDAVPKKRGPKTDVLEALLKRVDGLEKRLHHEKKNSNSPDRDANAVEDSNESKSSDDNVPERPKLELAPQSTEVAPLLTPSEPNPQTPSLVPDVLIDTYFARLHGKPYFLLDEMTIRQRAQHGQLPTHLAYAIYAVASRYATQFGGYNNAVRVGADYAKRARMEVDMDEPSIESLQTLLLLSQSYMQIGKGRKAYMLLTSAISMALALDLHRELPITANVNPAEREGRRRLFWSCYLLDRFTACGNKRPSLIADESIALRLPSWPLHPGGMLVEGDFFPNGSNVQYMTGSGKLSQGSTGMLIGIVKILGTTNRYLAAGGVKGDSHFPWHSLSNLSKIRQDLDIWASETQDTFTSLETLFGQPDSTILVLSKLIYHLIHCLIYRPFLPVDLAELSGSGQHQSWQIEATNLCFLHANAIAELVEIGNASSILDWPSFVGYCVCTAGTIHVHGAHYRGREGEVFSASTEFLSREMHQLSELRFIWAIVQHQRETLQTIYGCHSELVKSLASNPMRFAPVFQLEDFFDRYPGQYFDGAHVTFTDIEIDAVHESLPTYAMEHRNSLISPATMNNFASINLMQPPFIPSQPQAAIPSQEPKKKRRNTNASNHTSIPNGSSHGVAPATSQSDHRDSAVDTIDHAATNGTTLNGHTNGHGTSNMAPLSPIPPFSPSFTFDQLQSPQVPPPDTFEDPMFGGMPTGMPTTPFDPSQQQQPPPHHQGQQQHGQHVIPQQNVAHTPGAASASGSAHTDSDKDPFLTLLEQLAENEQRGGPNELDFFLSNG